MRKIFCLVIMIVFLTGGIAQVQRSATNVPISPLFLEDITGKPFTVTKMADIEGSPYLFEDWNPGTVKFSNGKFSNDVTLKFDVYNNRLFFFRFNVQFEFASPVSEFTIMYPTSGTDSQSVHFRNGYPEIGRNNHETYYEVLADGNIQLLKHRIKSIESFTEYNKGQVKKIMDKDQLYLFVPGKKFIALGKDKDAIIEALPEHAEEIKKITESRKLKLKTEKGLTELVLALNERP
jgi:hypothetical protein